MECLKALWTTGEANVHLVREEMGRAREFAYTTVMTLLDRLVKRGRAARRKQGRSFLYSATVTREQMQILAVNELVETLFQGNAASLIAHLETHPAMPPLEEPARPIIETVEPLIVSPADPPRPTDSPELDATLL
jgi:predicted transcriptional regulator